MGVTIAAIIAVAVVLFHRNYDKIVLRTNLTSYLCKKNYITLILKIRFIYTHTQIRYKACMYVHGVTIYLVKNHYTLFPREI